MKLNWESGRSESYPVQAGAWGQGTGSTAGTSADDIGAHITAAGPEAGGTGEAASIPICQSCVQSHAVIALVLFHQVQALILTASSSHRLYRQKINFRDTLDL